MKTEKYTAPKYNMQVLMPPLPYLCAAAATATGLSHVVLHNQIRTRTHSPITEFRSHLIWLLHSVSSLPYLLLHRPQQSRHASSVSHTRTHTHTHTHTEHDSVPPLSKHRTPWPNLVLITTQKALYKAQLVLRRIGRWRGESRTIWLFEEGKKTEDKSEWSLEERELGVHEI